MGTMLVTTFLTFFVIRYDWRYPLWLCVAATAFFMLVDGISSPRRCTRSSTAAGSRSRWARSIFIMMTWRRGRETLLAAICSAASPPLERFLKSLFQHPTAARAGHGRIPHLAPDATPHALLHSLKHYKVLHEQNVFLTVEFPDVPWVAGGAARRVRAAWAATAGACARATDSWSGPTSCLRWSSARPAGSRSTRWTCPTSSRARRSCLDGERRQARWRDRLFVAMARNAGSITDFFNVPTNRVVELGTRVEI